MTDSTERCEGGLPSVLGELAPEHRLVVELIAPPDLTKDLYAAWPRVWCRPPGGDWVLLTLTSSVRARQLAVLLATNPDGLRAKDADQALAGSAAPTGGVGRNARSKLLAALEDAGAADLFRTSGRGGQNAPPWQLSHATTDIDLALDSSLAAPAQLARVLTYDGSGIVPGFPTTDGSVAHQVSLAARNAPSDVESLGLPARLVRAAERAVTNVGRAASAVATADDAPKASVEILAVARPARDVDIGTDGRVVAARVLAALGVVTAAVALVVLLRPEAPAPAGVILTPTPGATVGYPTPEISGTVDDLGDSILWLAEYAVDEGGLHPFDLPCRVAGRGWTCGSAYLGTREQDRHRRFTIELLAVDERGRDELVKYAARPKTGANAYKPIARPAGARVLDKVIITRR